MYTHIHRHIFRWFHEHRADLSAAACGLALGLVPSLVSPDVQASVRPTIIVHWGRVLNARHSSMAFGSAAHVSATSSIELSPTVHDAAPIVAAGSVSSARSSRSSARQDRVDANALPDAPASSAVSSLSHTDPAQAFSAQTASSVSSPIAVIASSAHTLTAATSSDDSDAFPPMIRAVFPFARTPNWGAEETPDQWNRSYKEIPSDEFVPIPAYDTQKLDASLDELVAPERNVAEITRKLFYSTIFFGPYSIDHPTEFTAPHPALDLKEPLGMPVGASAGGRVYAVRNGGGLGLHVIIEHRHPTDGTFYSIYGHLGSVAVKAGDAVTPGQYIGTVGMTGDTTGPHLHWQIDVGRPGEPSHDEYAPAAVPSPAEARLHVINPAVFVRMYGEGVPL